MAKKDNVLTAEQRAKRDEKIIDLAKSGAKPVRAIAEQFNVTVARIYEILRGHGVSLAPMKSAKKGSGGTKRKSKKAGATSAATT